MIGVVIALMALSGSDPAIKNNRVPTASLIATLESKIIMPKGSYPLASYDRFYTEVDIKGRDVVIGQMIDHQLMKSVSDAQSAPTPPPVSRVLLGGMVSAFDGGCDVLQLIYRVGLDAVPQIVCNPPGPH